MKPSELMAKDLEERALQRKGVVELWGRSWKGELVVSLKEEQETAAKALSRALNALPRDFSALDDDDKAAIEATTALTATVLKLRGLMLELALHPTRPKAGQPCKPGAGRRSRDPITEATLVSIDGSAPEANPQENPDPEA
jgi:hypothetical protein